VLDLDRGADAHRDRSPMGEQPGEHVLGALEPHGDHRAAGFDGEPGGALLAGVEQADRKSTRLNSSHVSISYAVFCLKKKRCQGLIRDKMDIDVAGTERTYELSGLPKDERERGLTDRHTLSIYHKEAGRLARRGRAEV